MERYDLGDWLIIGTHNYAYNKKNKKRKLNMPVLLQKKSLQESCYIKLALQYNNFTNFIRIHKNNLKNLIDSNFFKLLPENNFEIFLDKIDFVQFYFYENNDLVFLFNGDILLEQKIEGELVIHKNDSFDFFFKQLYFEKNTINDFYENIKNNLLDDYIKKSSNKEKNLFISNFEENQIKTKRENFKKKLYKNDLNILEETDENKNNQSKMINKNLKSFFETIFTEKKDFSIIIKGESGTKKTFHFYLIFEKINLFFQKERKKSLSILKLKNNLKFYDFLKNDKISGKFTDLYLQISREKELIGYKINTDFNLLSTSFSYIQNIISIFFFLFRNFSKNISFEQILYKILFSPDKSNIEFNKNEEELLPLKNFDRNNDKCNKKEKIIESLNYENKKFFLSNKKYFKIFWEIELNANQKKEIELFIKILKKMCDLKEKNLELLNNIEIKLKLEKNSLLNFFNSLKASEFERRKKIIIKIIYNILLELFLKIINKIGKKNNDENSKKIHIIDFFGFKRSKDKLNLNYLVKNLLNDKLEKIYYENKLEDYESILNLLDSKISRNLYFLENLNNDNNILLDHFFQNDVFYEKFNQDLKIIFELRRLLQPVFLFFKLDDFLKVYDFKFLCQENDFFYQITKNKIFFFCCHKNIIPHDNRNDNCEIGEIPLDIKKSNSNENIDINKKIEITKKTENKNENENNKNQNDFYKKNEISLISSDFKFLEKEIHREELSYNESFFIEENFLKNLTEDPDFSFLDIFSEIQNDDHNFHNNLFENFKTKNCEIKKEMIVEKNKDYMEVTNMINRQNEKEEIKINKKEGETQKENKNNERNKKDKESCIDICIKKENSLALNKNPQIEEENKNNIIYKKIKDFKKQKNNQKDDIEDEEYISISFKDLFDNYEEKKDKKQMKLLNIKIAEKILEKKIGLEKKDYMLKKNGFVIKRDKHEILKDFLQNSGFKEIYNKIIKKIKFKKEKINFLVEEIKKKIEKKNENYFKIMREKKLKNYLKNIMYKNMLRRMGKKLIQKNPSYLKKDNFEINNKLDQNISISFQKRSSLVETTFHKTIIDDSGEIKNKKNKKNSLKKIYKDFIFNLDKKNLKNSELLEEKINPNLSQRLSLPFHHLLLNKNIQEQSKEEIFFYNMYNKIQKFLKNDKDEIINVKINSDFFLILSKKNSMFFFNYPNKKIYTYSISNNIKKIDIFKNQLIYLTSSNKLFFKKIDLKEDCEIKETIFYQISQLKNSYFQKLLQDNNQQKMIVKDFLIRNDFLIIKTKCGLIFSKNLSVKNEKINEISIKKKVIKIEQGEDFFILQDADLVLYSQGKNTRGQLGLGKKSKFESLSRIDYFIIKKIKIKDFSCGKKHTLSINDNKKFFAWGDNTYYQLSSEFSTLHKSTATPQMLRTNKFPTNLYNIDIQIKCGEFSSLILFSNKKIFAFGKFYTNYVEKFPFCLNIDFLSDNWVFPIKVEIASNFNFEFISIRTLDARNSIFQTASFFKFVKCFFNLFKNNNKYKIAYDSTIIQIINEEETYRDCNNYKNHRFSLQLPSFKFNVDKNI